MSSFFKDLLFDYTGQFQWGMFLLLVLLVVLVALWVIATVCTIISAVAANRFISRNEITSGTITRYYMREDKGVTTVLPMRCGNSSIFIPYHTPSTQIYYAELQCTVSGEKYLFRFAIPEDEYESEAVGSEITIQSGWFCEEYKVVAEE